MKAMSYKQFMIHCQREQRAYIADESRRIVKALTLWRRYEHAMHGLGLHALTGNEIQERQSELMQMERDVPARFSDNATMRFSYEHFTQSMESADS